MTSPIITFFLIKALRTPRPATGVSLRPFAGLRARGVQGSVPEGVPDNGGVLRVFQRPLTLILSQKYRDTNGSRIVIQIARWYIYYFLPGGGHTFAEVCHRNGRCIAILFKSIEVRGRFDSPEHCPRECPTGSLRGAAGRKLQSVQKVSRECPWSVKNWAPPDLCLPRCVFRYCPCILDIFETPCDRDPQQKISKTLNSSKIP